MNLKQLSNDDIVKNNQIKLSRKQLDYKIGEIVAKGKKYEGFIVE